MYIIIMPKDINQYSKERDELLLKIFDILKVTKKNEYLIFNINELDKNIDMQNEILELEPLMKKYFYYSRWSYYSSEKVKTKVKNKPLSLIKSILKDMNYECISKRYINKESSTMERVYYIFKGNLK